MRGLMFNRGQDMISGLLDCGAL